MGQLDLGAPTLITGVITQKRADAPSQFVSAVMVSSRLSAADDENDPPWVGIDGGATFAGPNAATATNAFAVALFPTPTVARYVRVHPTEWHGYMSMRCGLLSRRLPPSPPALPVPPSPPPPQSPRPDAPPGLPSPPLLSSPPQPPPSLGVRVVSNEAQLRAAIDDGDVALIVLRPGVYAHLTTSSSASTAFSITRSLTLQAEVAGTVVLDAQRVSAREAGSPLQRRRVLRITLQAAARVSLIGLNITGGALVGDGGAGILIDGEGEVRIIACEVYGNSAGYGGGIFVSGNARVWMRDAHVHSNKVHFVLPGVCPLAIILSPCCCLRGQ